MDADSWGENVTKLESGCLVPGFGVMVSYHEGRERGRMPIERANRRFRMKFLAALLILVLLEPVFAQDSYRQAAKHLATLRRA
jgi:hypothetical protein